MRSSRDKGGPVSARRCNATIVCVSLGRVTSTDWVRVIVTCCTHTDEFHTESEPISEATGDAAAIVMG